MRTVQLVAVLVGTSCKGTRLDNHIFLIVDYRVELLCRHAEQVANLVGQRTEIPDVCYRHHQLDVSATLATHFLLCYLNTASVADDTFVTNALVLATGTLVVACRTEDALTEQTVTLRLVGTIVDGFRLGYLAIRIFQNLLGRSETDGNLREIIFYFCIFLESHILYEIFRVSGLIKFDAQTETAKLMEQHVKRLGDARCWHGIALDNGLVSL